MVQVGRYVGEIISKKLGIKFYDKELITEVKKETGLSEKFIKGNFGVQVITSKKDDELVALLKKSGFGVSVIDVRSEKEQNEKYMLFIEIDKVKFDDLKKLIKKYDPNAFIVVNETKKVYNGYFTK